MENNDYLEASVDKFVFRVPRDRRYSDSDVWARREGERVRVGLTDFLQQKSGDVGFVTPKEVGTELAKGDELAAVETIKIDVTIPAPLAGAIVAMNEALQDQPELVNGDPYGAGWLVELELSKPSDYDSLLDAETYLSNMKGRAELELGK